LRYPVPHSVSRDLKWLALNFVFVAIAIVFVVAASLPWQWRMRYAAPLANACNPSIFVVAGVNAVLMAFVHDGASHILAPRLTFLGRVVVKGDALVMRSSGVTSSAVDPSDGSVRGDPPLLAFGADVRDALFVITPLPVLGTAVEDIASAIEPAFSGADVQALTPSGAAP
jgi:hypothetical protein